MIIWKDLTFTNTSEKKKKKKAMYYVCGEGVDNIDRLLLLKVYYEIICIYIILAHTSKSVCKVVILKNYIVH